MVFLPQDNPWEKLQEMAAGIGAELFFDGNGKPVLQQQPDPLFTPSSFDYVAGAEATVTELGRDLDDENAYNGVIVTGANNDNAALIPRGVAWDRDPNSPTYYDPDYPSASNYGPVPEFVQIDAITTNAQAAWAAQMMLLKRIGIVETIDFAAVCNPAHTTSDVIKVTDSTVGVDGNYLLESITLGLGEQEGMTGTTRKRRAA
jgi:hypothetical protein